MCGVGVCSSLLGVLKTFSSFCGFIFLPGSINYVFVFFWGCFDSQNCQFRLECRRWDFGLQPWRRPWDKGSEWVSERKMIDKEVNYGSSVIKVATEGRKEGRRQTVEKNMQRRQSEGRGGSRHRNWSRRSEWVDQRKRKGGGGHCPVASCYLRLDMHRPCIATRFSRKTEEREREGGNKEGRNNARRNDLASSGVVILLSVLSWLKEYFALFSRKGYVRVCCISKKKKKKKREGGLWSVVGEAEKKRVCSWCLFLLCVCVSCCIRLTTEQRSFSTLAGVYFRFTGAFRILGISRERERGREEKGRRFSQLYSSSVICLTSAL